MPEDKPLRHLSAAIGDIEQRGNCADCSAGFPSEKIYSGIATLIGRSRVTDHSALFIFGCKDLSMFTFREDIIG